MSNLLSYSLNSVDDKDSEIGSNNDNLIQNPDVKTLETESVISIKRYTCKEKFISIFLNIKPKKRVHKKQDNKVTVDEFMNKNTELKNTYSFETESNYSDDIEESNVMLNKFRTMVKKVLQKKKDKDWKEIMREYERKIKIEKSLKFKLKNIFNVNSDFIIIWKSTFSAFNIIFVYIYFLKYILLELANKKQDEEEEISNKNIFLYYMINIMFSFEFIFSLLILIFNGGSRLTYLKLPLKFYCAIPFPLEKKYIIFLIPKFFRIDLISRLFSLIETFINTHIGHYILNYYLKIFLTYTTDLFKILLMFGLYAHCLSCFFCYFETTDKIQYVSALYYAIQTFTTIGFGEQSPLTIGGLIVMIINLFLGVNFMSVITSNIKYLYNKIQKFNRETSFNEQFEFLIFQIQRSTGKVFPIHLKTMMNLFLLYRRGMAYYEIKNKNKFLLSNCRQIIVKEIHSKLFDYLKRDFSVYFENCEDDFIFEIFQNMRPKMFEANRTLISYNKKVKALYFLINGYIFIFNKNQKPVYCIFGNNLFAEYEFISQQKCNYYIKTHPKNTAFGFELKKQDWDNISKKYIISANHFLETIKKRKKKHDEWINWSLSEYNKNIIKEEIVFEPNIINTKTEEEKEELLVNLIDDNIINDSNEPKESNSNSIFTKYEHQNKKLDKTLIRLAKERNEKYDIANKEIFFNISEMRKKLKTFEDKFIDFKKSILNHLKVQKL